MDPYERSTRFVNTHLLARELSEPALLDAVRSGRAFIAFNGLADAKGFAFVAEDKDKQATMGERIPFSPDVILRAEAPLSCRFTLVRYGKPVISQEGLVFEYEPTQPGKYRIEASLPMPGEVTYTGGSGSSGMATICISTQTVPAARGITISG